MKWPNGADGINTIFSLVTPLRCMDRTANGLCARYSLPTRRCIRPRSRLTIWKPKDERPLRGITRSKTLHYSGSHSWLARRLTCQSNGASQFVTRVHFALSCILTLKKLSPTYLLTCAKWGERSNFVDNTWHAGTRWFVVFKQQLFLSETTGRFSVVKISFHSVYSVAAAGRTNYFLSTNFLQLW